MTEAFGEFMSAGPATAAQIELATMVVEYLTDQGTLDPDLLYDLPLTDVAPTGPDIVVGEEKVTRLLAKIQEITQSAVASPFT